MYHRSTNRCAIIKFQIDVDDPEDERSEEERLKNPKRLMIEREPIEEHFAKCRKFAIEWSKKPRPLDPTVITKQLARIDLSIRESWCQLLRENKPEGRTFARCIKLTAPTGQDALGGGPQQRDDPRHQTPAPRRRRRRGQER